MSLRLLHPPEPDPLPTGQLLVHDERRSGELHEVVALDEVAALAVSDKAARAGVSIGVALTLLIEFVLLEEDLADVGVYMAEPPPATPMLRLSAADASYLRRLTFRRPVKASATPKVAVPVRLLTRMTRDTLVRAAEGDLERAIRWEVAAVTAGRTVAELGLVLALRVSAAR
jgi:hypothetical protein